LSSRRGCYKSGTYPSRSSTRASSTTPLSAAPRPTRTRTARYAWPCRMPRFAMSLRRWARNSRRKSVAMQVAALRLFLRSLVPALEGAGAGRRAAAVEAAARALEPFGQLGLAEFAAFLARADEYRRTGAVRVPGAADTRAEGLLTAIARLTAA